MNLTQERMRTDCILSMGDDLRGKRVSYLCLQAPWCEGKCKARPFAATDLDRVSCAIQGSGTAGCGGKRFGPHKAGLSVSPELSDLGQCLGLWSAEE